MREGGIVEVEYIRNKIRISLTYRNEKQWNEIQSKTSNEDKLTIENNPTQNDNITNVNSHNPTKMKIAQRVNKIEYNYGSNSRK